MTRSISRFLLAAGLVLVASTASATDDSFGSPVRFLQRDGEALYQGICQGCHMPGGKGAVGAGAYPALAKDEKLETAAYAVFMVVRGNKAMPGFARQFDDAQVAAVVNYVRTNFGNGYTDAVGLDDVKIARP